MMLRVAVLLLGAAALLFSCIPAQRTRVRRQNMKVRINATGDTIVLKFLRPSPDVKLEGYILGYGSSLLSRKFIQLPENGQPYEAEMDAEPKYLVAVQPIPVNDVKKHCTGKVNLEKPLHLVIQSVSPSAVLLSWGNHLKTPYEGGNIMRHCLEDGFYTIRYRERNRKWIYQTCPTSDTVIDHLKPNTVYEFGIRSNKEDRSSIWSKPVIHHMGDKTNPLKFRNPLAKPLNPIGTHGKFPNRIVPTLHNLTQTRPSPPLIKQAFPGPRTSFAPPESRPKTIPLPGSAEPKWPQLSSGKGSTSRSATSVCPVKDKGNRIRNDTNHPGEPSPVLPKLLPTKAPSTHPTAPSLALNLPTNGDLLPGRAQPRVPSRATEKPHNPSAFSKTHDQQSPLLRAALAKERAKQNNNWGQGQGQGGKRNLGPSYPLRPRGPPVTPVSRNMRPSRNPLYSFSNGLRQRLSSSRRDNSSLTYGVQGANGEHHKGFVPLRPAIWSRTQLVNNSLLEDKKGEFPGVFRRAGPTTEERFYGLPVRASIPVNKKPNMVGKPGELDKVNNLKQTDKLSVLKPNFPPVTVKPAKQERKQTSTTATPKTRTTTRTTRITRRTTVRTTTTTATPAVTTPDTHYEHWEESDKFSALPASDIDAMGKKRYVAPHVVYKTDKKPEEPCSITSSLNYFPGEEQGEASITTPPKNPPSNLTVVTVEGCPSFIILDWAKTDNDTTEYDVISTAKGPDGEQVSIVTTNQTHTAVENLKPESSYDFKVLPKNSMGAGPPSEPVTFNTESADPRVSENVSGKDAIWTQFPFKTDSYSDCNGKQYVKRTWYRKFVGVQLCNSLRYKIYLSDTLHGKFYNIGDQAGHGEDHCQFVDSFLDGKTGRQLRADQLSAREGYYRAMRQEPVYFGQIGGHSHISYVSWYECGTPIPGKW